MHILRKAEPSDAEALQRLYQRSLLEAEWVPRGQEGELDFAVASRGEQVYVCVSPQGELMGLISVWEAEAFIHHLYVDPRFQRQGVGSALLKSLHEWLPLPWRLKCVQNNHQAVAFYRQQGWKPIDTGQGGHGPYYLMEYR